MKDTQQHRTTRWDEEKWLAANCLPQDSDALRRGGCAASEVPAPAENGGGALLTAVCLMIKPDHLLCRASSAPCRCCGLDAWRDVHH